MKKLLLVLALAMSAALILPAIAEEGQPPMREGQRPERMGRPGQPRMELTPQAMMERMMDRAKNLMKPSEEDWKLIQPRLEEVIKAQMELRAGGMMARGMRQQPPQAEGQPAPAEQPKKPEPTPIMKAADELVATLEKENATADEINEKLTVLRTARADAQKKLEKAQASLKEVVKQRQEAVLVLMGILE